MTAAIYARRAAKSVLVLEALSYGGQIVNAASIKNYPGFSDISGFDFSAKLYNQAKDFGAEFLFEKVIGLRDDGEVKTVVTEKGEHTAKAIILATGSESRKLGLQGEDELVGRGVSYCATCDGNFFRKKVVAVAGERNVAVEDALYLSDIAEKVYLIHRGSALRADESLVDSLKKRENVEIVPNSKVSRLVAEKRLTAVEVSDVKTGAVRTIELKGLFVAVGRVPENQNFASLVELDNAGYVVAGEDCKTAVKGIFAAGDNRTKSLRQLVTAASDGAVAATEAVMYINGLK